ncbi:MAG: hypothetical protein ACRCXC_11640 [Legionella sp.]
MQHLIAEFPATDQSPLLVSAREYTAKLPRKKFDGGINKDFTSYLDKTGHTCSNIMRENEVIKLQIEQLEAKYQQDLKAAKENIVQKTNQIAETLTALNELFSYSKYISPLLGKELHDKYEQIRDSNSAFPKVGEFNDLKKVLQKQQ